mmetsp:Transcript_11608/g.37101  ORF Transcript_11608/g.37101 Transcript_11608/m.37101 type:complete len:323 (-) Transcript_11608:4077-5045(-)
MCLVRSGRLVADTARTRQSVLLLNVCCSYCVVVVTIISSPCLLTPLVVSAVIWLCSRACFSISAICCRCCEGGAISMPRMMSRTSDWVSEATFTLFFLPKSARMRSLSCTSTFIHSSSVSEGQMWCASVTVSLSGRRMALVRSVLVCMARRMRMSREKAVYEEMVLSQSSYRLKSTICGSVALRMRSPSFSTLSAAWKGSCISEPLSTMLGKSSMCTSSGSSMPLRVTMICLGCSSAGSDRMRAATSSAVFHLASCDSRFCPAHTEVWMTLRKSCPVRGLKMKMAPLMGLVTRLPSIVLWMVTRYTLVSSTNQMIWLENSSP